MNHKTRIIADAHIEPSLHKDSNPGGSDRTRTGTYCVTGSDLTIHLDGPPYIDQKPIFSLTKRVNEG